MAGYLNVLEPAAPNVDVMMPYDSAIFCDTADLAGGPPENGFVLETFCGYSKSENPDLE